MADTDIGTPGLWDRIQSFLNAPPAGFYAGLGILAGNRYGSNSAEGLMQGLAAYQQQQAARQQYAMGQLQLQQQQAMQPLILARLKAYASGQGQGGPQQWAPPPAPGSPMPQQQPQGLMGGPAQQPPAPPPAQLYPAPTAAQISSYPLSWISPMADMQALTDPKVAESLQQARVAAFKEDMAPTYERLRQVAQSDDPARLIAKDSFLQHEWDALRDGYPDSIDGRKKAFAYDANRFGSIVGLPTVEPSEQYVPTTAAGGLPAQLEIGSGKVSPLPVPEMQPVIGKDGEPVLIPKQMSAGMTPASQFMLSQRQFQAPSGANGATPQDLVAAANAAGLSSQLGRGQLQQLVTARGLLAAGGSVPEIIGQMRAGHAATIAQTAAARAVGHQQGTVELATGELEPFAAQVEQASQEVPRGSWKAGTRLSQWTGEAFSNPALINFKAKMQTLNNVYDQIAARGGTDADKRKHIHELFDTATSPAGVARLVQALREEGVGAKQGAATALAEVQGMGRPVQPPAAHAPSAAPPAPRSAAPAAPSGPPPVPRAPAQQAQAAPVDAGKYDRPGAVVDDFKAGRLTRDQAAQVLRQRGWAR